MSIWGNAFKGTDNGLGGEVSKSKGYLNNLRADYDRLLAHRELSIKRNRPDYEITAIDNRLEELILKMDVYVRQYKKDKDCTSLSFFSTLINHQH